MAIPFSFVGPELSDGSGAVFPAESETLAGVSFGPNGNDFNGNVVLPASADVQASVLYGPNSLLAGNFVSPAEAQVENGVQFGGNGNEFTGSLVVTGGNCDPNAIAAATAALLTGIPVNLLSIYDTSSKLLVLVEEVDYQNTGAGQAIDLELSHPGISAGDDVYFGAEYESEKIGPIAGTVVDDAGQLKARIEIADDLLAGKTPSEHWKYTLVHRMNDVTTPLVASAPMTLRANQVGLL